MMINEEYLRNIGFTPFVEVTPQKRDEIPRLIWVNFYKAGEQITIRLIKLASIWEVELILADGEYSKDMINSNIPNTTIDEVIKFVKFLGTDTLFSS